MKRITGWSALIALLFAGVFTFAAHPLQAETVLRIVPQADLKFLDPTTVTPTITRIHGYFIYDRLFEFDDKVIPTPQMVDTYDVTPDGLTYTFTLRDGLRFHDGKPVTTDDVIASIKRWGRAGVGADMLAHTASLDKISDKTFRLILSSSWSPVLPAFSYMSGQTLFILPARIANLPGKAKFVDTTGSGPFKFVAEEWVPGVKVTYVKNQDYVPRSEPSKWASGGKKVNIDKVEWVIIKDVQTMVAALQTGELDVIEDAPVDLIEILEADPNIRVGALDPFGRQGQIYVNHLYPPFNNVKARQALLHLISEEELLIPIAGSERNWDICLSVYTCGSPFASDAGGAALARKDPETARKLLKEAGYNGEEVVLIISTTHAFLNASGLVLTQQLRDAGVNVNPQQLDWGTVISRYNQKDKPGARQGWNLMVSATKAVNTTLPGLHSRLDGRGLKGRQGWSDNPEFERLKNLFNSTIDFEKQKEIARDLQILNFKHVAYIPHGQWRNLAAWRKELKDFVPAPIPVYWGVNKN